MRTPADLVVQNVSALRFRESQLFEGLENIGGISNRSLMSTICKSDSTPNEQHEFSKETNSELKIKGEAFKYVLYRYLLGFYPYAV